MRGPPACFFLCFFIFSAAILFAADIPLGSTLSAADPNSKWASPDGTFSFTFIPDPSGVPSASFAAVIYDGNPDVPIWIAGGSSPDGGAADSTASLRLLRDGNLELRNGSSNSLVWQSSTSGRGVTSAVLDDLGNFVLKNATVSEIWSTFANPTDTIDHSQNFTQNEELEFQICGQFEPNPSVIRVGVSTKASWRLRPWIVWLWSWSHFLF